VSRNLDSGGEFDTTAGARGRRHSLEGGGDAAAIIEMLEGYDTGDDDADFDDGAYGGAYYDGGGDGGSDLSGGGYDGPRITLSTIPANHGIWKSPLLGRHRRKPEPRPRGPNLRAPPIPDDDTYLAPHRRRDPLTKYMAAPYVDAPEDKQEIYTFAPICLFFFACLPGCINSHFIFFSFFFLTISAAMATSLAACARRACSRARGWFWPR
jgi:hypothetical protein